MARIYISILIPSTMIRSELIISKLQKAQVSYDTFHYLECCRTLVSAFNDSTADMELVDLFNDQLAGPKHLNMYRNILTSCTDFQSIDYVILKIALLLCDDQTHAIEAEDKFALLDKSFHGVQCTNIVIRIMKEANVTYFPAVPALTISQFYFFSSLFFGRLTNEVHALRLARKALVSLKPGESGRTIIEQSIRLFSSHEGACAVCRNPCIVGMVCSGCNVLTYCSHACQKRHWKHKHKEQCCSLRFYCEQLSEE